MDSPFHVESLPATPLHPLGLDSNKLTDFHGGQNPKLIGVTHVALIPQII